MLYLITKNMQIENEMLFFFSFACEPIEYFLNR